MKQAAGVGAMVLLVGAPLCGCGRHDESGKTPSSAEWVDATVEDRRHFSELVVGAVNDGDGAALNELIDWDVLIDQGIREFEGLEEAKRGFKAGVKSAVSSPTGLVPQLARQVAEGGSFSVLRVHDVGDEQRILFRLLGADGSVNYHDMIVVKAPDGELRVVDIYVFATAELSSETLRRAFLPLAAEGSKSFVARLTQPENDFLANLNQIGDMVQAANTGNTARALSLYRRLPKSLQKSKNILLVRLQAAMAADDAEYASAIEDFRTFHPEDPCIDMYSIDGYILKEQYDEALASVDRLDDAVGGDPYLDVMRANINVQKGAFPVAKQLAERAIAADGTLVDAYWALIVVSLEERNFDETVRRLDELNAKFETEISDLTGIPEFAGFVQSSQYDAWIGRSDP